MIRLFLLRLAYLIYLIIIVVFLLEITFRVLPTSSPVDLMPVSDEEDILRFEPNQKTTFSLGKDFYKVVKKSTNNYGFYSSYDYLPDAQPDIAIIGDSLIEAAQIRNIDTFGEIIQSENSDLKVYQFGVSGIPLSQYIQMIKYAEREFSPKYYAIAVVGNDFDESLCNYRIKEGTWCFDENLDLVFNPFLGYQGLRAMARKSAIMRYVVFNVGLNWREILVRLGINDPGLKDKYQYTDNTNRIAADEVSEKSRGAIRAFFKELKKMDVTSRVIIVLDADRNKIYDRWGVTKSYFNEMRSFMKELAIVYDVKYIDMDPVFRDDFAIYKKSFQFPTDGHWNEYAHNLAAKELLNEFLLISR